MLFLDELVYGSMNWRPSIDMPGAWVADVQHDQYYIRQVGEHFEFMHAPMMLWVGKWVPVMARTLEDAQGVVQKIIIGD